MKLRDVPVSTKSEFCSMVANWKIGANYKGKVISENDQQLLINEGIAKGWYTPPKQEPVPENKSIDLMMAEYYVQKHQQCITRGISFELSLSDLKKLYAKKTCYYSGERVELSPTGSSRNAWTLDRKDNSKGYTRDNVVVCAKWVNGLKNELFEKPDGTFRTNLKTLGKILSKIK